MRLGLQVYARRRTVVLISIVTFLTGMFLGAEMFSADEPALSDKTVDLAVQACLNSGGVPHVTSDYDWNKLPRLTLETCHYKEQYER